MKKIAIIFLICTLFISVQGASGLNFVNDSEYKSIETEIFDGSRDYTHTVLVEVGTATWCPSCPASNLAWHSIYGGGQYDFEYTEMVIDKNTKANQRMSLYNLYWVPTSYFDGGEYVYPGTNYATFYNYLNSAGARSVPDLNAEISAEWLGSADVEISISIENNDNNAYPGRLRVYIIELESSLWNDYNGNPYYHAFLDFVWDQTININSGSTFSDTKTWHGSAAGYPNVQADNLQIILAVFDDTANQGYSDPPSGAPFNAYYVDETVATVIEINQAPNKPTISGPTSGDIGVEYDYTFNAIDPNGDDVYYWIDWGDGLTDGWIGPTASGEDVVVGHTYTEAGVYEIKAKAKDTESQESEWSDPYEVIIGNLPPSIPHITGPTTGKPGVEITYAFCSEDPNQDDITYTIDWGDGKTEDFGPVPNGVCAQVDHTFLAKGTYTIKAMASDGQDTSDWGELTVTMPRSRTIQNLFLIRLLEQFKSRFPILQYLGI